MERQPRVVANWQIASCFFSIEVKEGMAFEYFYLTPTTFSLFPLFLLLFQFRFFSISFDSFLALAYAEEKRIKRGKRK